ncbi:FtsX-like permease family protein [Clostridium carnis]
MSKLFYPKLAINNIKKNSKTYFPYVITCICTITMFYIMHSISINKGLNGVSGSESLKAILGLGTIIIGIFSAIFLFYTNSFLIKRRKKEIGLYNVLGLEKKHIAKILFFENIFISFISFIIGIISGVILNKLMFLFLLKLLNFPIPFGFSISMPSVLTTVVVFAIIFFITLLSNLFQIKIANPIELLKGGQQGEKEPKTKWIITIIGFIALGAGYGIALSVKSPLTALNFFFIAVILVMIGTYSLFTAGSIALLKFLRKNKKFYYRTKNFTAVSGMMYRMKQNAVGLANICILSTAVLVMISTTVSLYVGMEDALRHRYPKDIIINASKITEGEEKNINKILENKLKESNVTIKNKVSYWSNIFGCKKIDDKLEVGYKGTYNSDYCFLIAIPISDYNRLERKDIKLENNEAIIFSTKNNYSKESITLDNKVFKIKEELQTISFGEKNSMDIVDTYILIVNDIYSISEENDVKYSLDFDVEGGNDEILLISNNLNQSIMENNIDNIYIDDIANSRDSFLSMYGGLFFLGIFLGVLFLMATVLIIYYKQISEGYDDKERFEIMKKVGMSNLEIKKTIKNQVLMVFFLPLIFTVIHIAFAFPIITKLLALLNLTNVSLFKISTIITILIFAVIYAVVFSLTARVYYKIVE